jgi:hypothetical protein
MRVVCASSSEVPPIAGQPKPVGKLNKMRLFLLIAVLAIAGVASAFGLIFLYPRTYTVAIRSTPSGSGFVVVDGNMVTTPCNFSWMSGSSHNITASSRASSSGVQYAYSSWSDGGAQSHTVTVNGMADYTANFVTLIPLTYNFVPGEQMIYSLKLNASSTTPGLSQFVTENATLRVVSFDGEYYTINATLSASYNEGSANTGYSTFVVNKTGYEKSFDNVTFVGQEVSSIEGNFVTAFRNNETRAGDTWQIFVGNVSISNSTLGGYVGNLTESFGDLQNLTVPAGTFRVFSMDFSADNLTVIFPPPFQGAFSGNYSFTGREYLEYGTNRLISMEMQSNLFTLFHQQNYTTSTNTFQQMELMNLVVP